MGIYPIFEKGKLIYRSDGDLIYGWETERISLLAMIGGLVGLVVNVVVRGL